MVGNYNKYSLQSTEEVEKREIENDNRWDMLLSTSDGTFELS